MANQPSPESESRADPNQSSNEDAISSTPLADSTGDVVPEVTKDAMKNSAANIIEDIASSAEPSTKDSPNSKKRALPEPCAADEPSSKKPKASPPAFPAKNGNSSETPEYSARKVDKETWQGFCDIESEPAYFSVILREMGVQSVTVREVFAMDPAILETLPQPIHGLILLFNYREFGKEDQATECPPHVWFANQLPAQNSCATLAMINILMNSTDVGIGEHLDQFKDFTRDFTPFQRGEALASFDFVKKIHNSFAKKMDMLESDKYLSYKVKRASRLKNEKAHAKTSKKSTGGGTRSRGRRATPDSTATDDSAEGYEDNAHHYIAFVPVGNEVWKLDGLDAQPTSMGTFNTANGETWLSAVSDTIAALMAAGDDNYGVIALTQSPLLSLREKACRAINTIQHVETRLSALDKDWHAFTVAEQHEQPSPNLQLLGIVEDKQLPAHPVPSPLAAHIDAEQMPDLLDRRARLVGELGKLAASIVMEMAAEEEEEQKATQRRYDCGPVIKKWLEMLAENGHLEENLERFMPAAAGKKGGK